MEEIVSQLQNISLGSNSAYDYVVFLGILFASLLLLKIFQVIILSKLKSLAKKTKTDFDDVLIDIVGNLKPPFYLLISIYFAIQFLTLIDVASNSIKVLFLVVIVYEVVRSIEKLLSYFISGYLESGKSEEKKQNAAMAGNLRLMIKIVLWVVGLIIILSNLGVNVTSLIASLGIGGIAIALALQNVLADMFSSFSIYIDKPFKVGDYIVIGTDMGTVKRIGLKTTRIETLQGEELVVSNQELTTARVQNFKKMERRRVAFTLGVVYGIDHDKLEKIPSYIKEIVELVKFTEFDRCHFKSYGDFSLNFEVTYYVNSSEYKEYMDLNQEINLAIYKKFAEKKIEFAYPTQTVFIEK
jgi:small-conductance mechanosensitive channel